MDTEEKGMKEPLNNRGGLTNGSAKLLTGRYRTTNKYSTCPNKSEVHWARVPPLCGKMKSTFSCAVEVDDI